MVDRLLASPRYGERWGRHWLDLARYADSNGMDENMAQANAFRYRDYVIRSFNADKPYDLFLKEQIAGDRLPPSGDETADLDRTVATGFLVLGPKMLAEDDPVKMEMDIIDEQVDTVGPRLHGPHDGLCARCHDHKFDPIPTADYYGLAGIFKSTKSMANHKVVAMWNERSVATKAELLASQTHQKEATRRQAEIDAHFEDAKEALGIELRSKLADYLELAWRWERSKELRKSLLSDPIGDRLPPALTREAESFDRGNVLIDTTNYGPGIGVILNKGEQPNFVEYDVDIPEDRVFQVEVRHTSMESRPVRLKVDAALIASAVSGSVTGSWGPEKQEWTTAGLVVLKSGRHTIRLERDGPFPHIDRISLVSKTWPPGVALTDLRTVAELAEASALRPQLIERWADYLEKTKADAGSVFQDWIKASTSGSSLSDVGRTLLARGYQTTFELAASAKPDQSPGDSTLVSFRKILDDPAGPFSIPEKPESLFLAKTVEDLDRLRKDFAEFQKTAPPLFQAMSVEDQKSTNLKIHIRGNHMTLGEEVPRHFLQVLTGGEVVPLETSASGRLELAIWLARPEHPLTARVMVNRIWLGHFGEGILRSPDNFGNLGDRPDHPELLDWLANRFVESGWSIKAMHRLIMLSSTYQMSTIADPRAALLDPENRLLSHRTRRRLEAEAMRDAILSVSGELDLAMGGILLPTKNHAYISHTGGGSPKYDGNRRSVYLPVIRSGLYDVFQAFDFADPSASNGQRIPTTVAPQALFMMNDSLVLRCSEAMARRLLARSDLDLPGRIREAYLSTYGRPALDKEIERAEHYLRRFEAELETQGVAAEARPVRAWQALCQAILGSSEFLYLD